MVTPAASLSLYRQLLRAARGFANYNFRDYAVRYVRDDFRAGSTLTDAEEIAKAFAKGQQQLKKLKRQSLVSQLYPDAKHSME